MFLDILHDFPDIERERCLMIGDSESDVMFAMNSGIRGEKYEGFNDFFLCQWGDGR